MINETSWCDCLRKFSRSQYEFGQNLSHSPKTPILSLWDITVPYKNKSLSQIHLTVVHKNLERDANTLLIRNG